MNFVLTTCQADVPLAVYQLLRTSIHQPRVVLRIAVRYALVALAFSAFLAWNRGIVLGRLARCEISKGGAILMK